MSRRDSRAFAMVVSVLALVLAGTTIWLGRDEYRELARERGETIGTQTVADEKIGPGELRIGTAERQVSGIQTAPLEAAEADATIEVYGVESDRDGQAARVRCVVEFSGEARKAFGLEGLLPPSAVYRFDLDVAEEGGSWKVRGATWEPAEAP